MHNRGDLLIVKEPLVRVTARETSPLYFLRSFRENRCTKEFWDTANCRWHTTRFGTILSRSAGVHDERIAEVDSQFFEAELCQGRYRRHGVDPTTAVGAKQTRQRSGHVSA